MCRSIEEEELNEDRMFIRKLIYQAREAWLNLTNSLRLYLAFRLPLGLDQLVFFQEEFDRILVELKLLADEGLLTFEQEEELSGLDEVVEQYRQALQRAIDVHSGDQWRRDTFFFSNEMLPLVDGVKTELQQILEQNELSLAAQTDEVLTNLGESSRDVLIIVAIAIIIGLLFAWIVTQHIVQRLGQIPAFCTA